jgi:glycosyltransferase involved in cell wall biosynthesis
MVESLGDRPLADNTAHPEAGSGPPLVSVFTAACDIGPEVATAYRSLLRQTYPRWEWVVLDDSRGIGTWDVLVHLAGLPEADGRLRVYRQHPPSGSVGAAKAAAAALCRGEILVELDHDDELLAEALEVVAATFRAHPDLDFVYSDWIDWRDGGGGGEPVRYPPGWGFGLGGYAWESVGGRRVPVALAPPLTWETVRHLVGMPNHLRAWRAAFYQEIGGHDARLPVADDYDLLARTFLAGMLARIPRPLYIQHHDSRGGNTSRRRNAEIQRRVAELAAVYGPALDHRCTSLGLLPAASTPTLSDPPLPTGNACIDVAAEAAAAVGAPLVSVVMPTYRRPESLRRAIASVLAQTYPHLELLVVGDACPCMEEIVGAVDDPRLRYWNLARHHGDAGASPRNYALAAMARGTLIAYLDDDNRWREDHLASLVGPLVGDPTAAFAFGSLQIAGETILCRRPRRFQIDTSALLHRRSLIERFGYWRPAAEADGAHDWDLVSRWEGEAWLASLQPTLLYTYDPSRHHPGLLPHIRAVAQGEERATVPAGP